MPGKSRPSGLGIKSAPASRACRRIDPDLDRVDLAAVRVVRLVGQAHRDRKPDRRFALALAAFGPQSIKVQADILRNVEGDASGIRGDDRGQASCIGDRHISLTENGTADPAGERRRHLGELEVESGNVPGRLSDLHSRVGLKELNFEAFDLVLADHLFRSI